MFKVHACTDDGQIKCKTCVIEMAVTHPLKPADSELGCSKTFEEDWKFTGQVKAITIKNPHFVLSDCLLNDITNLRSKADPNVILPKRLRNAVAGVIFQHVNRTFKYA